MDWSKINTANIKAAANVVIAIAALFLSGAISFPPGTSEAAQHTILAWDAWILTIVAALNGVMHFVPDFTAPTPKVSATVTKALLVGLLCAGALAFIYPTTAHASGADTVETKVGRGPVTPPTVAPPNGNIFPAPGSITSEIFTAIINYFSDGMDKAEALSLAVPSIQDGNGHDCAVAGQQLMSVLKAKPEIISGHAAADLEGLRITVAAFHNICANAACQKVFSEGDNAIATLGIGITIPTFEAFCAKLPAIAIVPPTVTPTPTPTASPTSTTSPTPAPSGG